MIALAMLVATGSTLAQKNIRQVNFKSFTYPLNGHLLGHDRLQWLTRDAHPRKEPIHLLNGSDLTKVSSFVMDGNEYAQWEGFTLQSVGFAELTGDGKEEAIVVLRYDTGGTQNTHYVYVYSFAAGKPNLLAYCYTGARAFSGLYRVYGEHGLLVFELFDQTKRSGDCCSSGIVRTRYRWQGKRFERVGTPELLTLGKQ